MKKSTFYLASIFLVFALAASIALASIWLAPSVSASDTSEGSAGETTRCNTDAECQRSFGEGFSCVNYVCTPSERSAGDREDEIEPFFNDAITCSGPFLDQDGSKKGKDNKDKDEKEKGKKEKDEKAAKVKAKAWVSKNLSNVSQTGKPEWGNRSCLPAAGASILEFWNRTFPSILGGRNLTGVVERLRNLSKTDNDTGTTVWNFTIGLTKFLNETGYAKNFTFKGFVYDPEQNDSTALGTRDIRGLNVTFFVDNDINFTEIVREASTETVILEVSMPGVGNHAVAVSSYNTEPDKNGQYSMSIMDPASGSIVDVKVDDSFGTTIIYPDGTSVGLVGMYSLSPKGAAVY